MAPDDFAFLARLLRRRSGLSLTTDKAGLLDRRLMPVMRRFGFKDMAALIRELRLGSEALADGVTQAMTVNESSFFRDPVLFDTLRDSLLPGLMRARDKRLRIWSAAAAAGQEAYSIAIMLSQMGLARKGWTIDIIATDLSADAVARGEAGRYAAGEIARGLSQDTVQRYFQLDDEALEDSGAQWVAQESLRRMITFRRFNLLDSFGWLNDLDIIFCRNVLMYFDAVSRASVLERIAETLAPDGILLLGENELPDAGAFVADGPGIYLKRRAAIARAG